LPAAAEYETGDITAEFIARAGWLSRTHWTSNACNQRQMNGVLKRAGVAWHGFRRGLAPNLNRFGVDDSMVQRVLGRSNVATYRTTTSKPHRPMRL
jgi:hypothetical protein